MEAFPLSSPSTNSREKSILIIDEIDSSIHPIWQSRLLNVLRACFPTTQIICTTHSPLMLAGLDRDQILEVKKEGDKIIVQENAFDTWATSYKEILKTIFKTSDFVPTVTVKELERQLLKCGDNEVRKQEIQETLDRLLESQMLADDLKKYELALNEKEKELDILIEEYKEKAK